MKELEKWLQHEANSFAPQPDNGMEAKIFGTIRRRKVQRRTAMIGGFVVVLLFTILSITALSPIGYGGEGLPSPMSNNSETSKPEYSPEKVDQTIKQAVDVKIADNSHTKINNKVVMTATKPKKALASDKVSSKSDQLFKTLGLSDLSTKEYVAEKSDVLDNLKLKLPDNLLAETGTAMQQPEVSAPASSNTGQSYRAPNLSDKDIVDENIRYAAAEKKRGNFKVKSVGIDLFSGVSMSSQSGGAAPAAMLMSSPDLKGDYSMSTVKRSPGAGLSGGVSSSFRISRHLSLNTGLFFSRYSENIKVNNTRVNMMSTSSADSPSNIPVSTVHTSSYNNAMNMLELPVSLGLALNPNSKLVVMLNVGGQYSYRVNNGMVPQGMDYDSYANHHLFSVLSGVNLDIPLWHKNSIVIGPEFRYFITNTYAGGRGINNNRMFFGLRTGFNFGF